MQPHPEWRPADRPPALAAEEVHVWRIPLECGDAALVQLHGTLADDERQRAARFHFEKDRRHFISGRGALRAILALYLDGQPEQVRFVYTSYGKPQLAGETAWRFNLTHSHGLALLAVTLRSRNRRRSRTRPRQSRRRAAGPALLLAARGRRPALAAGGVAARGVLSLLDAQGSLHQGRWQGIVTSARPI